MALYSLIVLMCHYPSTQFTHSLWTQFANLNLDTYDWFDIKSLILDHVGVNLWVSTIFVKKHKNNVISCVILSRVMYVSDLFWTLQVGYDGDPEAALASFANHAQASAAYRCSEPLFNNRFIKIFWYNPDRKTATGDGTSGTQQQSKQVTVA